jgi:hypothetical protein
LFISLFSSEVGGSLLCAPYPIAQRAVLGEQFSLEGVADHAGAKDVGDRKVSPASHGWSRTASRSASATGAKPSAYLHTGPTREQLGGSTALAVAMRL